MATSAPQAQSQPPSAEEEVLKRNTDCVYFLASPLTCKKPLEGLLGTQVSTFTGPSAPVPQVVIGPTSHVSNAFTKPAVACVFFQKGHCLKGDWCLFLHAPIASNTKVIPVPVTVSAVEPANMNKPSNGVEKPLKQKVTPINVAKSLDDTARAKPLAAVKSIAPRYKSVVSRRSPQTSGSNVFYGYRTAIPISNGNLVSWSSRAQQSHMFDEPESMNNKDAEEVLREQSLGFDVLIDDEGRDSEFYPGEDRYGISGEHEPGTEYEISRSADYSMIAAVDDDRYQGPLGYDSLEHRKGRYAWE